MGHNVYGMSTRYWTKAERPNRTQENASPLIPGLNYWPESMSISKGNEKFSPRNVFHFWMFNMRALICIENIILSSLLNLVCPLEMPIKLGFRKTKCTNCINPCHAKYIDMPCQFLIVNQSDYLIQIVDINSCTEWQTVQIQISWLLKKPADLNLHCLQR